MIRLLSAALGLLLAGSAVAQVSITTLNTPYTQDFDTLPASGSATWTNNSTIPGWFHARTGTGSTVVANDGASNAGNLYSYGTGTNTERALGSLGSGNAAIGNLFWGVRLQNNTSATITSLQVSYTGEQWRNSAAAAQTVSFSYLVGAPTVTGNLAEFQSAGVAVPALDFTSPITGGTAGALNGNLPANRVALSHTITGLSIPPGTEIMLRWSDPDHTGADHGLAIDDFSVSAVGAVFTGGGLTIPSLGVAAPYPSTINVAGLSGSIVDLTVRINGFSHTFPDDVDVLLVAPNGQNSIVFSDVGGAADAVNVNLALNAGAASPLPDNGPLVSGTFQPTNIGLGDPFAAPAPAGPHPTDFTLFYGPAAAQNGNWQLFVVDDLAGDAGSIASWALEFTLAPALDADLSVTLADSPDPVRAGNNLSYTATATNNGPADADDVTLSLPLPATTTFVAVTPSVGAACTNPAVGANGTVSCTWAGTTANAGVRSMTVVANVPASTANGAVLNAILTGSSTTSDPDAGNNTAPQATTVNTSADLSISLADSPDPVTAGTNLTYTAVASNGGPSDAQNVSITLPLPAGTSFVSATPSAGGVCNAVSPVVCSWAGATAPMGSRTATIVALVAPATTGTLNATAAVTSTTIDEVPTNNEAVATTTVDAQADLSITLADSPDPVNAGSNLTYTAVASNGGPSDAQNVSITLPLPAGTSFVSATPSAGGVCNAVSPVVCSWAGATAPMGSRTATIVALVAPATTGTLNATATVASATVDPVPGNNAAVATTTVDAQADLSITLADSPDPVIAGNNLSYTAVTSNAGPSDASGVSISLPLPAGTSFVSATPSAGGVCNAASPVVCSWAGATAPGVQRTATIVALVAANVADGTVLSATATAASSTPDPNAGNNSATAQTTVNTQANLAMALSDSPDPVAAGSNLTYTATVSNAGPSDAQTVAFSLPLAAGTSLVSSTPSTGGVCAGAATVTCTWAGATATGVNRTATIVVLVDAGVANGTVLSATATASSATTDPVPGNNSATATTTVNAQANLALTLTASTPMAALGEVVTFTATSTNLGPSNAADVQIVLTLSPDFRYSSHNPGPGANCTTPQIGQSGAISCTWAGPTAAGASRTLAVSAVSNVPGTSSVMASTSSPTADPVAANNTASVAVLVGNPVEPIPTLGRYSLILLGLLLGLLGLVAVRQRV